MPQNPDRSQEEQLNTIPEGYTLSIDGKLQPTPETLQNSRPPTQEQMAAWELHHR